MDKPEGELAFAAAGTTGRDAEPSQTASRVRGTDLGSSTCFPRTGARNLLLVATGSISVAYLPASLTWLRLTYPQICTRVVVTRSAERFVSREALSAITGNEVYLDTWPQGSRSEALHVEWGQWAHATVVFPATYHFVARLALGLADSPALLAVQCGRGFVGIAPALPPGGWESPAMAGHVAALRRRPRTVVADPLPARSWTTGRDDAWRTPPLGAVLTLVDSHRDQPPTPSATVNK
ncbi:flavoprotein [Streptomyces sp. R08]|uniref:Flavoprotein n=1 Tax=Streptomyces sp. R08 TaxID=3238624 RepID=A0AB39MRF2_9ACTN